jgi:hypothetical protein
VIAIDVTDLPQPDSPDQADDLAGRDVEADAVDRDGVRLAAAAEGDPQVAHLQQRGRGRG